ncbi:UDP-N-acetylmuramoyl-L-alanine--D-glutamate ligase [Actinomadura alba]|uniref:UDP-N-acetylmuramoylalanine--D-glutamate ligase n=1 Tax=Actinomadura alba TaxID=406431 RepID=A0ABR7LMD2_9ACTN|nr:UDP-N-acetylmuramoyl-L-alanine--D-glutamate ligase [Actinomadura alba]MBC6465553.1 UDP-N-acetylmuramoyl-L-alanine--D-glutamate ligase [Actinomadura alba]
MTDARGPSRPGRGDRPRAGGRSGTADGGDAVRPGTAVCVAGLGVSGLAAARVLAERGARVTIVDARDDGPRREQAAELERQGITVRLGDGATLPAGTEIVVTSPGWRPDAPLLTAAAEVGVEVLGEVELAWRLRGPGAAPWLALTGTNGKTTAVRMLACILTAAGHRAMAVGNVGTPIVEAVACAPATGGEEPAGGHDVLAVELSSYQLHWSDTVAPYAAAVLNVAPDHLDWHGSMEAYAADKGKIFVSAALAVVNADDPWSVRLAEGAGRTVGFTLGTPAPGQLGVVDGLLVDRAFVPDPATEAVELAELRDIRPFAPHNVANALAAAALARAYGVPTEAVREGLRAFRPDPHRNAPVATVAKVDYVDDSKATNPHAAAASLAAYDSIVWIAGGLLKGADVDDLVRSRADRLRGAVLLGADRAQIARALARHAPNVPVVDVSGTETESMDDIMDRVVAEATRLAAPGDTVLLAPAGASFDMFTSYGARGDAFAAAVRRLAETR